MTTTALVLLAAVIALAMLAETWLLVHLRRQSAEIQQRSAELQQKLSPAADRGVPPRRLGAGRAGLRGGSLMNDFELPTLDGRTITRSHWSKHGTSTDQSKRPNCGSQ